MLRMAIFRHELVSTWRAPMQRAGSFTLALKSFKCVLDEQARGERLGGKSKVGKITFVLIKKQV
jgi:hypothetical protein